MELLPVNSLYIHIPFCISKCYYCDFFSVTDKFVQEKIPDSYISALVKEIEFYIKSYKIKELKTIYIGGGTPSLLQPAQLERIIAGIKNITLIENTAEITIEVNPDDITEDLLEFYKKTGINRISCGIQSLNNKALKFCHRRASLNQNIKALQLLKKSNLKISVDIICGLPEESEESFFEGLEKIVSLKFSHISMYSLTIEDETPLGKMTENGTLNYDFDFSDDLWLKGRNYLAEKGYAQYEVSNFANVNESENKCSHNLVYWNHESYLGCGSGAAGTVYFKNGQGIRWNNSSDIELYIEFWNKKKKDNAILPRIVENIDLGTSKFEFFMMGLRKLSGITRNQYKKIFNEDLPASFINLAEKWKNNNLLEIKESSEDTVYCLNYNGILYLNKFLEDLDIY